MKIKKVLCSVLATVMAASLLSVGMVSVASAATSVTPSSVEVPASAVVMGEYPLNNTTMPDISAGSDTVGKYTGAGTKNGLLQYSKNLAPNGDGQIKIGDSQYISFKTNATCYITIMPIINESGAHGALYQKSSELGSPILEFNDTNTTRNKVQYAQLSAGEYFITGTSGKGFGIEEIEFSADKPADVLWRTKTDSKNPVAYIRTGESGDYTYYAIAVVADTNTTVLAYNNLYFKVGTGAAGLTGNVDCGNTLYKEVTINNQVYDAAEFATGFQPGKENKAHTGYLYAAKLDGDTTELETALSALIPGDDNNGTQTFITLSDSAS